MNASALRTYIEHHLTGASGVTDLVARRIKHGDDDAWLAQFLAELQDEAVQLRRVARHLPAAQLPHRVLGRVAMQGARVRLALEAVLRGDAFRELLEFEVMRTGVGGKQCLWHSLLEFVGDPALAGLDLDALLRQAHQQADQLERRRLQAARTALGD